MRLPNIIYKTLKRGKIEPTKYPNKIDLGLTNWCNLNCLMCPNDKITDKRGYMDEKLFYSIVDCVSNKFNSQSALGFGLYGESTLHPNFVNFLKYTNDKKVKVIIATNFVSITKEIIDALVKFKVDLIEISFYTYNEEEYNRMVGREKYKQTLANIYLFLKTASRLDFGGRVRLRPFKKNELKKYYQKFYNIYPNINFQYQKPKIIENWTGYLKLSMTKNIYVRKTCSSIFSRISIDWNGESRLCCKAMLADDLFIGYVSEYYNIYDIWSGHEIKLARERFNNIDYRFYPSCIKCMDTRKYIGISDLKE